jgi:pimeloyl-ACP methyl ester carboxylesterase
VKVVLVGGTRSFVDPEQLRGLAAGAAAQGQLPWCHPSSAFAAAARASGVSLLSDDEPFLWSTDLELGGALRDWWAAAAALAYYCRWLAGPARVTLVAHSHGGQVAALAVGRYGVACDTLVTLGMPVRRDMQRHRRAAVAYARRWIHVFTPEDPVQVAGAAGCGADPRLRDLTEYGVENVKVSLPEYAPAAAAAHSALHDPARWTREGWWAWLR